MALDFNTIIETAKTVCEEVETYEHRGQLSLIIPSDKLIETAKELRDNENTKFNLLVATTAIDWLDKRKPRFEVVYFLYSIEHKSRVRLKVPVTDKDLKVPSLTGIHTGANWFERETYDMYGVVFEGHPNLRRFYMPEDYKDPETGEKIFPLRKDFPLMGIDDSLPLPPYPEKYGELD
jgi:NADH-quinone oxidoreductase subunit C